jgi:hypothetical protein
MQEQSTMFADRLQRECAGEAGCEVRRAYKLTLGRPPRPVEVSMSKNFFAKSGSLQQFCLAMLNRNEFIYIP